MIGVNPMKILLIEDDTQLCMTIKEQLTKEGYIVDTCNAGDEAFLYAVDPDNDYDLAIIDRMLPIIDGLSIIKAMRQKNIQIPVIIITGMSELNDKIEGLDNGADDYLIKPFHIKELSARVRALVRRPPQIKENITLEIDDLSLNLASHQLSCNHNSLLLTPKEFHLIRIFLSSPGTIFSREQLLQKVWNTNDEVEPGNVDNYIYFLRKRLKCLNSNCCINSVYGSGYSLEVKHD